MRILPVLILSIFIAAGCGGGSGTSDSIFSRDETADAANIVDEANRKLRLIKKRFKNNEPRYEELKNALKNKDEAKVREISDGFVNEINAGTQEGSDAIDLLKKARDMNVNSEFRLYLDLKIVSLEKYIEAFDQRRQAAEILRDGYDPKSVMNRDRVVADFKLKEEKFNEIIEEGRQTSQDANDLAMESLKKKN